MPTAASAHDAITAFWREQLKGAATKQLRIHEAIIAVILDPDTGSANGAVVVSLDRLDQISELDLHLEAEGAGTSLRVFVADAGGNEIKPEPQPSGYPGTSGTWHDTTGAEAPDAGV